MKISSTSFVKEHHPAYFLQPLNPGILSYKGSRVLEGSLSNRLERYNYKLNLLIIQHTNIPVKKRQCLKYLSCEKRGIGNNTYKDPLYTAKRIEIKNNKSNYNDWYFSFWS